jgi:hypothetical protein
MDPTFDPNAWPNESIVGWLGSSIVFNVDLNEFNYPTSSSTFADLHMLRT